MASISCHSDNVKVSFVGDDVLSLLNALNRPDLIPEFCSLLIFQCFWCLLHLLLQFLYQFCALAFKQVTDGLYVPLILFLRAVIEARSTAKMQVVLKAGSRHFHGTACTDRIVSPQNTQRLAKAAYIRKRAVIFSMIVSSYIPCYEDARPFIPRRDFDIWIWLVISQGNIIFRVHFLDQIAFQDQCFHLRSSHGDI